MIISGLMHQSQVTHVCLSWHIEAETKWPPFSRRHFQIHFREWKCINFDKKNSLKFVPKGSINNIPALVQIMAWCRSGDKPLSEPVRESLLTHICVTRPQWVNWISNDSCNDLSPDQHQAITWIDVDLMFNRPSETYFSEMWIKTQNASFKKTHFKLSLAKWQPLSIFLNVKNT